MRSYAVVAAILAASTHAAEYNWDPVNEAIEIWAKEIGATKNFAFNIGDETGRLFVKEIGNTTMDTELVMESSAKWPSAIAIMGLVEDGTIPSADVKASEYLPYWTKDPLDNRSSITLAHLLSFTSGCIDDDGAAANALRPEECLNPISRNDSFFDFCTEKMYHKLGPTKFPGGKAWDYNSYHEQFAGAIAVAAASRKAGRHVGIQEIFEKYLFTPNGMIASKCNMPTYANPQLAVCLRTTGNDYEKLLKNMMIGKDGRSKLFSAKNLAVMEKDYTGEGGATNEGAAGQDTWFGHYSFGHWWECFNNPGDGQALPGRCTAGNGGQEVHGDPGGLAYFPLINRHPATHDHPYYLQVVVNEQSTPVDLTGVPEYLRIAIGPIVDAVFRHESKDYFRGIIDFSRALAPTLQTFVPVPPPPKH
jgi:hypothetical protein